MYYVLQNQIYRHGDRSPAFPSPSDSNDISNWPDGWGQLTNVNSLSVEFCTAQND